MSEYSKMIRGDFSPRYATVGSTSRDNDCDRCDIADKPTCPNTCDPEFRDTFPLAMAYVPWQKWQDIYDIDKAYCAGTIFAQLDLPFYGRRERR